MKRGEIWYAELDPIRGSEQAGVRPVLIIQHDRINRHTSTVLAVPLTTNLRRESLPFCYRIAHGEGGLTADSVALCHQTRALDRTRLRQRLGEVSGETLTAIEDCLLYALGID